MTGRSCLLALLLVTSIAGGSAKNYLTGKLVRVDSEQTKESRIYVIYIEQGERSFSVRLVGNPAYELEWAVDGPIEFRLEKDAIYLKRPNGKELKFPSLNLPTPKDGTQPDTLDLPFPPTPRQTIQTTPAVPEHSRPGTPRCAEIAPEGAQFGPLADACEYALSPSNLPNFVCQETVQRSARSLSQSKWKNVDVVTVEAGFSKGRSDRYSKFAINGHPIELPPDIDRGQPLIKFLIGLHTGGWWSTGEFGALLVTVFNHQTAFQFNGNVDLRSGSSTAFGFRLSRANNFSYHLRIGDMRFNPGLEGSLWIDSASGKLLRVEAHATDLDPLFPSIYHSEAINYGDVPISQIGTFLLPTAAEILECNRALDQQAPGSDPNTGGMCYRNVISFHDCRKFVTEAHIVPDTGMIIDIEAGLSETWVGTKLGTMGIGPIQDRP